MAQLVDYRCVACAARTERWVTPHLFHAAAR